MAIAIILVVLLIVVFALLFIVYLKELDDPTPESISRAKKLLFISMIIIFIVEACFFAVVFESSIASQQRVIPPGEITVDKPVIYLYPEEDNTDIDVKLENTDINISYPEYSDGWHVTADRDGLIKDGNDQYKYLYWEGLSNYNEDFSSGFCVEKSNTIEFLKDKLSYIGLNEFEIEDFITYWLPQLNENNYNVIHFVTEDEVNDIANLSVNPTPDNKIRVYMLWYGFDSKIEIEGQEFKHNNRDGFTVVEWGGTKINK